MHKHILVDVSDIVYFFCSVELKEKSKVSGGGGGGSFLIENPKQGGGVLPGEGGGVSPGEGGGVCNKILGGRGD